ncbi:MAG: PA2169 family four-helix-bundle protein [Gammaproteobacteria bacterium]
MATLNDLIETSKDGEKGFALAAKESKEPSLTILFSEGEQSCRAAVAELQDQVRILGGNPEDDGSMKAAIHRGWISLKSAASSRDTKAILEECERGEDYAKARYAEAVKQDLPETVRTLVERQYHGVVANHDRVRDLRNQYRT